MLYHELFVKYHVPKHLDLLSIDIDSTDLWVWRALCGHHVRHAYRPRVVVIEFNRAYDLYEYLSFPNDPTVQWPGPRVKMTNGKSQHALADMLMGASLSALYLAGRQMGYRLVYVDSNSINAFFLRDDLLATFLARNSREPTPGFSPAAQEMRQLLERVADVLHDGVYRILYGLPRAYPHLHLARWDEAPPAAPEPSHMYDSARVAWWTRHARQQGPD